MFYRICNVAWKLMESTRLCNSAIPNDSWTYLYNLRVNLITWDMIDLREQFFYYYVFD